MTMYDSESPPRARRDPPDNTPNSDPAQLLPDWMTPAAAPASSATPLHTPVTGPVPGSLMPLNAGGGAGSPPGGAGFPQDRGGPTFYRGLAIALFLSAAFLFVLAVAGAVGYVAIASDLPAPDELRGRAAQFASTRIYDREGKQLNEVFDPDAGRRTPVTLDEMAPFVVQATIATEDANFYNHPGVDPVGIARAVWQAVQERATVSGGSTIAQQLVKLVFLSPERTWTRKIKEAILAAEITRTYPRDQILEIYLNEINYGNMAYGIESAAQTYFDKPARDLNLPEAALLAGLPQAPAFYDPYTNPEGAKARQAVVLKLMVKHGYITAEEADTAWLAWDAQNMPLVPPRYTMDAPHFVVTVREQLERMFGPEILYKGGLEVYTTLDSTLQTIAEDTARNHVARFPAAQHVTNAAVVALRPQTGEILAMLGSVDFNATEIAGQVNVTTSPRQPGSAIKPLTYLAAFELDQDWWTPATTILDIRTEFPDGAGRPPYVPTNYDDKEHGLVTVRSALANSYNIPAVATLQHITVPRLIDMAKRLGIESLTRPDYGLSLTLGGGEVTLLELTNAYGTLANQGTYLPPVAIQCVLTPAGDLLGYGVAADQLTVPVCQDAVQRAGGSALVEPAAPRPAVQPAFAYLVTSILSDNQARTPAFGPNSPLRLPGDRPAAVKTGTTNDFRDNWTIGYTPDLVVGTWVGNSDGSPMRGVSGVAGAGPIWNGIMTAALKDTPPASFPVPAGVGLIEVCSDSGTVPGELCPARRSEVFVQGRGPLGAEHDIHRRVRIFRAGDVEYLAPPECPDGLVELREVTVYPPEGRQWAIDHGIPQPPTEVAINCQAPEVAVWQPSDGATVSGVIDVVGKVQMADFDRYVVEYGEGDDPLGWGAVAGPFYSPVDGGTLGTWDTRALPAGAYTLRVRVWDRSGHEADARVRVNVETALPTATPTGLPAVTLTPTPTATFAPLETPTPTPAATDEPPTATPVPFETPTPVATPTPEPGDTLILRLDSPQTGEVVQGDVQISGVVTGAEFASYGIDYGVGPLPAEWITLVQDVAVPVPVSDVLALWSTVGLADGVYTIRLQGWRTDGSGDAVTITLVVANAQ